MAHPHNEKRAHKVERARIGHITEGYESGHADRSVKHYATGGGVKPDAVNEDKVLAKAATKEHNSGHASGGRVKHRADRFARGGKVKGKGTTVNVNISPSAGSPPLSASPPMPPRPVAPPTPAGPPMAPAPGGAPPMPMRARGGKVRADGGATDYDSGVEKLKVRMKNPYVSMQGRMKSAEDLSDAVPRPRASGGGVNGVYPTPGKGTSVFRSSVKDGTPVQHDDGKQDTANIGRGRVVTYKTGGAVEHAVKGQMAPHLPGGSGGGEARLAKAHKFHKAAKGTFSNASGK